MWQPSWSCPREGWFFPPTLFTEVSPAATIAQVEIFGPVVVLMTFRTPAEAVELANNTRYGLAASVWTENINLALDIAPAAQGGHGLDQLHQRLRRGERVRRVSRERVRAGRGTGGVAGVCEVGGQGGRAVGRSGGRQRSANGDRRAAASHDRPSARTARPPSRRSTATPKLYIGGKQVRPDSGYSLPVLDAAGSADRRGGAREPKGHPQRGRGGAQGGRVGAGDRAPAGAGAVLHRREPGGAGGGAGPPGHRRARWSWRSSGSTPGRRGPTSTTGWCITRPTATSPSPCRSRSACWASSAPTDVAAAGTGLDGAAGDRHGEHGRRDSLLQRPAVRRSTSIRCSTPPTCRAGW